MALRDNGYHYRRLVLERFQTQARERRLWEVANAVCLDARIPGVIHI